MTQGRLRYRASNCLYLRYVAIKFATTTLKYAAFNNSLPIQFRWIDMAIYYDSLSMYTHAEFELHARYGKMDTGLYETVGWDREKDVNSPLYNRVKFS
jgi:hypothetical protein